MNCTKCELEITTSDDSLKCRGPCGQHFHRTCLSGQNKAYIKAVVTALIKIKNLLWFCDDCLPNITDTLSSNGNDTQSQSSHNHTNVSFSLADCVFVKSSASCTSQTSDFPHSHTNDAPDSHAPSQQSESQENSASSNSASSMDSVQPDASADMELDEIRTDPIEHIESNAGKRRRVSTDDDINAAQISFPIATAVKHSSTNYRCIYLSPFTPSTNESKILQYATTEKKRIATEIMECKRLLPAKCNMNKISFVSFKLTVHEEFYDTYTDPEFWPKGVTACDFDARPSKKRLTGRKLRVNPFSIQNSSQFHPKQISPKYMPRSFSHSISNRLSSYCRNRYNNNNYNGRSYSSLDRDESNHIHRYNNKYNGHSYSSFNHPEPNRTHRVSNVNDHWNFRPNKNHQKPSSNQKNHQHQFTFQSSRSLHRQNQDDQIMQPRQLMALVQQLNRQINNLLNRR